MRLARIRLVSNDDPQRQRLLALCQPNLKIDIGHSSRHMVDWFSPNIRLLDIVDFGGPLFQLFLDRCRQQQGEGNRGLQVLNDVAQHVVHRTLFFDFGEHILLWAEEDQILPVEIDCEFLAVAAFQFDTQMVRAIDQYLTHRTKLDLLPAVLHDVIASTHLHTERLGLGEQIRHAHQQRLRVLGLRGRRHRRRVFFGDCCGGQSQPGNKEKSKRR